MARSTNKPKIDIEIPPLPTVEGSGGGWPLFTDHVDNWAWKQHVFSPQECQAIINLAEQSELEKASTYSRVQSDKVRNSFVKFLMPNGHADWIFARMADTINDVNDQFFRFDLQTLEQGLQFTRYTAPGQHYSWHVDRGHRTGTRKLSVSIQLNDPAEYKGGELQFRFGDKPDIAHKQQGMGIFFPSYTLHRVTPVTKGTRYSLVAWVSGPPFK